MLAIVVVAGTVAVAAVVVVPIAVQVQARVAAAQVVAVRGVLLVCPTIRLLGWALRVAAPLVNHMV